MYNIIHGSRFPHDRRRRRRLWGRPLRTTAVYNNIYVNMAQYELYDHYYYYYYYWRVFRLYATPAVLALRLAPFVRAEICADTFSHCRYSSCGVNIIYTTYMYIIIYCKISQRNSVRRITITLSVYRCVRKYYYTGSSRCIHKYIHIVYYV